MYFYEIRSLMKLMGSKNLILLFLQYKNVSKFKGRQIISLFVSFDLYIVIISLILSAMQIFTSIF